MKRLIIPAISALVCSMALTIQAQPITATVDFEGLKEGDIVSSLTLGAGYGATENLGSIGVVGTHSSLARNAAMIFDSNCPGGCSGEDLDLKSNNGNVLIITEDFNSANPDDNADGGQLEFDFTTLFAGSAYVDSLQITDTEAGGTIDLFDAADVLLASIPLPRLADGATATVNVDVANVARMCVSLVESGSVDAIELIVEGVQFGGCTPGFWSQRGLRAGYWPATGYAPTDSYNTVFGTELNPDLSLYSALTARGNTAGQALLRHSVAALLNAAHPEIFYPFAEAEIKGLVEGAWDDGSKDVLNALKDTFDDANNGGCFE